MDEKDRPPLLPRPGVYSGLPLETYMKDFTEAMDKLTDWIERKIEYIDAHDKDDKHES